jgi:RNA polymerase sigma-70 factor, ECF subfamily
VTMWRAQEGAGERSHPAAVGVETSDEDLIALVQQRDAEAADELCHRYGQRLYRFIFKMVQCREDAEDITQNTLLRALVEKVHLYRGPKFSTWLYRIARNLVVDFVRARNPHRQYRYLDGDTHLEDKALLSMEYHVIQMDESERLLTALEQLSELQRSAVELHWLYEWSDREIAIALGKSTAAVKQARSRGMDQLNKILS